MERYAAFLRGINLGSRRAAGEELRVPFLNLGVSAPPVTGRPATWT
jgi:uncharacterized protein (DUF1697 family)